MRINDCGERRGRSQMHGHMGRKMAMMAMGAARGMRGGGWGGAWGDPGDDGSWGKGRGGPGGRGGPPGRGGRRMFAGGELRLLLLYLIATDRPVHGYELIKKIEEMTGGEYAPSPGVVYPTLSLLLDEGKIREVRLEDQSDTGRKIFAAQQEGQIETVEREDEAKALVARLQAFGHQERPESPPVKRAIANLFTALRQRMAGTGDDAADSKQTAHAIADILDEAARKIERL